MQICVSFCGGYIFLGGLIYLKSLDDKFKTAFKRVIAFSGFFSSWSRVTKRLPMMAPEAFSQAARKVASLLIPKPDHPGIAKIHFFDLFKVTSRFCPFKRLVELLWWQPMKPYK
mgnify:CR=1 FL=1